MGKITIGEIEDLETHKKYNLYCLRGYKKYKNLVFIGNHTKGVFFKFDMNNDTVRLPMFFERNNKYDTYKTAIRRYPERKYPPSEYDLKEVLEKVLWIRNLKLLELDITSREGIKDRMLIEDI